VDNESVLRIGINWRHAILLLYELLEFLFNLYSLLKGSVVRHLHYRPASQQALVLIHTDHYLLNIYIIVYGTSWARRKASYFYSIFTTSVTIKHAQAQSLNK
jgi:hypothetical protein